MFVYDVLIQNEMSRIETLKGGYAKIKLSKSPPAPQKTSNIAMKSRMKALNLSPYIYILALYFYPC